MRRRRPLQCLHRPRDTDESNWLIFIFNGKKENSFVFTLRRKNSWLNQSKADENLERLYVLRDINTYFKCFVAQQGDLQVPWNLELDFHDYREEIKNLSTLLQGPEGTHSP